MSANNSDETRAPGHAESPHDQGGAPLPWYRRTVTWVLGLAAAAVTAFVVAIGSGLGQQTAELLTSPAAPDEDSPSPTVPQENEEPDGGFVQAPAVSSVVVGSGGILVDESPEEIDYPEPADTRAANDLALDLGGIAARWQTIEITVQGPDDEAIVLNDLRVRVVEDDSPLAGVLFTEDVGGSTILRPFSATIAQGIVTADAEVIDDDPLAEGVAPEFPYVVSALDPEVFSLYVTAVECDCTWVAELEWTSDGERDVTVIDDEGTPFRMSSVESVQATYDVGSGDLY